MPRKQRMEEKMAEQATLGEVTQVMIQINSGRISETAVKFLLEDPGLLLGNELEAIRLLLTGKFKKPLLFPYCKLWLALVEAYCADRAFLPARQLIEEFDERIETGKIYKAQAEVALVKSFAEVGDFISALQEFDKIDPKQKLPAQVALVKVYSRVRSFAFARQLTDEIDGNNEKNLSGKLEALTALAAATSDPADFHSIRSLIPKLTFAPKKIKAWLSLATVTRDPKDFEEAHSEIESEGKKSGLYLKSELQGALVQAYCASGNLLRARQVVDEIDDAECHAKGEAQVTLIKAYCQVPNFVMARGLAHEIKSCPNKAPALVAIANATRDPFDFDAIRQLAADGLCFDYNRKAFLDLVAIRHNPQDIETARQAINKIVTHNFMISTTAEAQVSLAVATRDPQDLSLARRLILDVPEIEDQIRLLFELHKRNHL